MNEFTKEELERLIEGISWWLDGDSALYSEQLINKIQAMIDNYCEHLVQEAIQHCNICSVSEFRCMGCLTVSYEGLK